MVSYKYVGGGRGLSAEDNFGGWRLEVAAKHRDIVNRVKPNYLAQVGNDRSRKERRAVMVISALGLASFISVKPPGLVLNHPGFNIELN